MPIQYRINILESLKEQGINTTDIKKKRIFSDEIVQAFRTGRIVKADNLSKVCKLLECSVDELLVYVPECAEKPQLVTLSELRKNQMPNKLQPKRIDKTEKTKNIPVDAYVSEELIMRMVKYCNLHDVTASEVMSEALKKYFVSHKNKIKTDIDGR